ncbi:hypothetical protein [Alkalicoccobacillus plakortidis]|uniref:XapX domain-containing protein n=1 Tax=Alkalicoccobacillus plakortidis TaxID=444060 RepID=A0ABT0XKF3_9BACI|nr:hypothetical protein [Alkalicoccobacillus plakortidis]MCM2676312.1 hypothetical protein [Alkalicoccobacillus plakortidis]
MKNLFLMLFFLFFGIVGGYLVPLFLHDISNFPIELPVCVLLGMVLSMQILNYMTQSGLLEKITKKIT